MMLMINAMACGMSLKQCPDWHCVLYHKQATSARTRFFQLGRDVVLPEPVECSIDAGPARRCPAVRRHPAAGLAALSDDLGIPVGKLRVTGEPLGTIGPSAAPVWLVELLTIDPPASLPSGIDGHFISIMETRDLPPLQRELLRTAYERILG